MKKSEMSPDQLAYNEFVEKISPKSHMGRDCFRAFWVGGFICAIGQGIAELLINLVNLEQKTALAYTSIILVFLGATLTGIGIYDVIGKYAAAGSVEPRTGFSNSVVAPAMEFKPEGLIMGIGGKLFTVAGPVLVYGISSSIIVGIIYWIAGLIAGGR